MLRVINIFKKFGELVALNGVSLAVDRGECRGIIGPNGAGKTTLFNIISGFMKPTSGRVIYDGLDITNFRPYRLVRLGLVRTFQIVRVFKNLTVYRNFLVVNDDPEELMRDLGLWDKRDLLAKDLSFGELRKLSIGLALSLNPKLLLLDEPFSGLSPRESADLSGLISSLRDRGVTTIIIEHKLKELFDLVDRVTVLNSGRVIFDGDPNDVVNDRRVIEAYLGVS